MVCLAEQNPSVGIVSAYRLWGDKVSLDGLPYNIQVLPGREMCRLILLGKLVSVFGTANSHLFRSDLVRAKKPFYDESNLHADAEVCYELLKSCDFGFVHQVLTFSRTQEGSLTSVSLGKRTQLAGFLNDLVKFGPYYLEASEYKAAVDRYLCIYYGQLGRILFQRRGKAFWDFHRRKLAELGLPLSRIRVATAAVRRAADVALGLNYWPYALFKRLWRLVRGRGEVLSRQP